MLPEGLELSVKTRAHMFHDCAVLHGPLDAPGLVCYDTSMSAHVYINTYNNK